MATFSQRSGFKLVREIIQIESIYEPLKNSLWSLQKLHIWDYLSENTYNYGKFLSRNNEEHFILCNKLWLNYFKFPLDQLTDDAKKVLIELRNYFFNCEWYEIYDFIEFLANNYERHGFKEEFINHCNIVLEKEMSAYRFVNGLISEITSKQEINEIENAIDLSVGGVTIHLRRSLELLSDRESPDYRNSIKESISAVESYVSITVGSGKGTLGNLLKKLEDEVGLHAAMKTAFINLYGYTSDKGGIRHAMTELEHTDFADAKFMLVVCSAFINFVEGKAILVNKQR